jgi:hypothetical protein
LNVSNIDDAMRLTTLILLILPVACTQRISSPDGVIAEVTEMTGSLIGELEQYGPSVWMEYFEDDEPFFMESDDRAVFPSSDSTLAYIDVLARNYKSVELKLLDLRIDVHSRNMATIVSPYRESLVDMESDSVSFSGLLTALLVRVDDEWLIRNLHWSSNLSEEQEEP